MRLKSLDSWNRYFFRSRGDFKVEICAHCSMNLKIHWFHIEEKLRQLKIKLQLLEMIGMVYLTNVQMASILKFKMYSFKQTIGQRCLETFIFKKMMRKLRMRYFGLCLHYICLKQEFIRGRSTQFHNLRMINCLYLRKEGIMDMWGNLNPRTTGHQASSLQFASFLQIIPFYFWEFGLLRSNLL